MHKKGFCSKSYFIQRRDQKITLSCLKIVILVRSSKSPNSLMSSMFSSCFYSMKTIISLMTNDNESVGHLCIDHSDFYDYK